MNEYSLQAPFIYDFYTKTIKSVGGNPQFRTIQNIRMMLESNENFIETHSFGTVSKIDGKKRRQIKHIAKRGISEPKYSELLYRICRDHEFTNILELGTSFGISTLYLAQVPGAAVTTFEGCTESLAIAQKNFTNAGVENIQVVTGNIDVTLEKHVENAEKIDFVFFDANHKRKPTLKYFEICLRKSHDKTIYVFDDIHWSEEMKQAWQLICAKQVITLSIDLFQLGIVFVDPGLSKQHYILAF